MVVDGETTFLTGDLQPREGESVHDQIAATGAPGLLLARLRGPARVPRAVPPRPRGVARVPRPRGRGRGERAAGRRGPLGAAARGQRRDRARHAHLPPDPGRGVRRRARWRRTCAPAGTRARSASAWATRAEDLDVAEVVGRFFLVANAVAGDTSRFPNVERTEAAMSEGFYEAVIRALAGELSNRSYNPGYSEQSGSLLDPILTQEDCRCTSPMHITSARWLRGRAWSWRRSSCSSRWSSIPRAT